MSLSDRRHHSEVPGHDELKHATSRLDAPFAVIDLDAFDRNAAGQVSTGFTTGGTGWYRKTFVLAEADKGKRISLEFDGIYREAPGPVAWLG